VVIVDGDDVMMTDPSTTLAARVRRVNRLLRQVRRSFCPRETPLVHAFFGQRTYDQLVSRCFTEVGLASVSAAAAYRRNRCGGVGGDRSDRGDRGDPDILRFARLLHIRPCVPPPMLAAAYGDDEHDATDVRHPGHCLGHCYQLPHVLSPSVLGQLLPPPPPPPPPPHAPHAATAAAGMAHALRHALRRLQPLAGEGSARGYIVSNDARATRHAVAATAACCRVTYHNVWDPALGTERFALAAANHSDESSFG
jgi:hypothetical protein